jgi:hypothetical protein
MSKAEGRLEAGSPEAGRTKRGGSWKVKALIAIGSFAVIFLAVEIAARSAMPDLAPVKVREGYYQNPLPLITGGGPPLAMQHMPKGERLIEEKAPNEMRVFFYGESSVWGSPFDEHMSVCAMLYDMLREAFPKRKITVVNMGRPGSIATNVYYYLIAARRFSFDWAVFFMGYNDREREVGEQCFGGTHPLLHGAWRMLVEHSWALWLARAFGPQYVWKWTKKKDWHTPTGCSENTFPWWTEHLVRTAMRLGAKVVVATPVASVEAQLEGGHTQDGPANHVVWTERYKSLVACRLTKGCDYMSLVKEALKEGKEEDLLVRHRRSLNRRADTWRQATEATGAELIEFHRLLREKTPSGVLGAPHFGDWLRLLPHSYMYLARLVGERIRTIETGLPERPVEMPGRSDVQPYLDATVFSGVKSGLDQIYRDYHLTGIPTFEYGLSAWPPGECEKKKKSFCEELDLARIALGWLRQQAGLEHGLSPELAKRLESFDPKKPYKKSTL